VDSEDDGLEEEEEEVLEEEEEVLDDEVAGRERRGYRDGVEDGGSGVLEERLASGMVVRTMLLDWEVCERESLAAVSSQECAEAEEDSIRQHTSAYVREAEEAEEREEKEALHGGAGARRAPSAAGGLRDLKRAGNVDVILGMLAYTDVC
jgi:hypothetical protein